MRGNISFGPLPHDTAATTIAEDDFNGDGIVDVATAVMSSNMVQVYFMNADGTLSQPAQYPVGSQPLSVITADFNHDNQPDLAVTNIGDNTVSVLLGKTDGTFQPAVTYPAGVAVTVSTVAPGVFTEPGTNSLAAAGILRVHQDLSQTPGLAIQCSGQGPCTPLPISLDPSTDQVYLILYGTGLRAAPQSQVSVTIGGTFPCHCDRA